MNLVLIYKQKKSLVKHSKCALYKNILRKILRLYFTVMQTILELAKISLVWS